MKYIHIYCVFIFPAMLFPSPNMGLEGMSGILWHFFKLKIWELISIFSSACRMLHLSLPAHIPHITAKWASVRCVYNIFKSVLIRNNNKSAGIAHSSSCIFYIPPSILCFPIADFGQPALHPLRWIRVSRVLDPAFKGGTWNCSGENQSRMFEVRGEHLSRAIPPSNEMPNTMKLTELFYQRNEKKEKTFFIVIIWL